MNVPDQGQPVPPYPPASDTGAAEAKPRNRTAAVALILALLAWLVAAFGIWLIVASHAWTTGCRVDKSLRDAGTFVCLPLGGLLSLGAVVTGLASRGKSRGRSAHRVMGVVAMVTGAVGLIIILFLFTTEVRPHAVNPAYLHPC
jgi:predicted acyltransferase